MALRPLRPQLEPEKQHKKTGTGFLENDHPSLHLLFPSSRPSILSSSQETMKQDPVFAYLRSLAIAVLHVFDQETYGQLTQASRRIRDEHVKSGLVAEIYWETQATLAVLDELPAQAMDGTDLIDCDVEIKQCGRRARAWTTKCLEGMAITSNESVSVMEFERKGGVWMCYRLIILKGVTNCG